MNAGYYWSRMLAFAAIGVFMLGLQSLGEGIRQWRQRERYERLAAAVADAGTSQFTWWLWPPQLGISGHYQGIPFRYANVGRESSHLLLSCEPKDNLELSRHRVSRIPVGLSSEALENILPGWTGIYARRQAVPLTKRSLDRRPPGFGSAPGIDLYRQRGAGFSPDQLRADLIGLQRFCAQR